MDLEKKKLQFKKNDEIVITIEDLGKDGEGIGHVDGYALFVRVRFRAKRFWCI